MTNRRDFLKTAAIGAATVSTLSIARSAHSAGSDTIRIGLVGCGGRGLGALYNALEADSNIVISALGDLFPENVQRAYERFKDNPRCVAKPENVYSGFDNYKGVIENCDVVILATTPHYRPIHFKAAVEAGKHVFFEKPNGVDAAGVRSFLESGKIAAEKKLTVISGLCWRYHTGVVATMDQIKNGLIGDIREIECTYLTGRLWSRPRNEGDTEMMFQNRNWYNFDWLSGDFNVEQHVHTLDKANWLLGTPEAAWGSGARSVRVEQPKYGNIYDQMSVSFEYKNGVKVHSFCRQIDNCLAGGNQCRVLGAKGMADVLQNQIIDLNGNVIWKADRKDFKCNMYVHEHEAMFDSIRNGKAKNDVEYSSYSTLMGILGREVCYTGQRITWEQILNSKKVLAPKEYTADAVPPVVPMEGGKYAVPLPGMTKFE